MDNCLLYSGNRVGLRYMKTKYIIFTALFIGFSALSPVKAEAAWYNPFTWFAENLSTSTESVIAVEVSEPTYATSTESVASSTPEIVTKTVVETKVVTKYVDNPKLVEENKTLKAQIAVLTAKVNELRAERNLPPIEEVTVGASNEVPVEVVAPVQSSVTIGQPYCVEVKNRRMEQVGNDGGTVKLVEESYNPKRIVPRVDVSVSGNWSYGSVKVTEYPENNDQPQTTRPKHVSGYPISKEKQFINIQNVTGSYPVSITVFSEGDTVQSTYTGEVVIDKPCI